jgi:hypothetical membrane protein
MGPILFIVTFLLDGATRPGYNPWRNLVSQLSTGEGGWVQIANFIVCGVLVLAMAVGLLRSSGSRVTAGIVAIFGVALILAGVFVTDPGFGYPPGTLERRTLHGAIHEYVSIVGFLSLGLAPLSAAMFVAKPPARRGWRVYSIVTGIVVLVSIVVTAVAVDSAQAGTWPDAPTGVLRRTLGHPGLRLARCVLVPLTDASARVAVARGSPPPAPSAFQRRRV